MTGFSISEQQFERVRRHSLDLAGIQLVDRHRELLASRCRRIRIGDEESLNQLLSASERGEPEARRRVISLLTISHTGFFRNPRQFELAAAHAIARIRQAGRARLWCAGCSTGEEPYSLAISILKAAGPEEPRASILATDVNPESLETARRGEYAEAALRCLDPDIRKDFFTQPVSGGTRRIADAVRSLVAFEQLNLIEKTWPIEGPFDVVFCRNILMYFALPARSAVLRRIGQLMEDGGLLLMDPAEHLGADQQRFRALNQGAYCLRTTSEA